MTGIDIWKALFFGHEIRLLNDRSMKVLDDILDLLDMIDKPEDQIRKIWIYVRRGAYEEYIATTRSKDRWAKNESEFLRMFPNEEMWFPIWGYRINGVKFLSIRNLSFRIDTKENTNQRFPYDYRKLLSGIKECILTSLKDIKKGIYNEKVKNELPYSYRFGTIKRKEYWKLHRNNKKHALMGLKHEEKELFIEHANEYVQEPELVIEGMNFQKYFEIACACYQRMGLEIRQSLSETFFAYAEDFGGGILENEIDYDSEKDFNDYLSGIIGHMGGHPWGIIRGTSRTRIMLFPKRKGNGFFFRLSGNPNWNVGDFVRIFITLRELNVPFMIYNSDETINYLKEEDLIGFVSEDTLPVYCQMYFANQEINDFRHFDGNKDLRLLDKITWLPVEEVKLKK